MRRPIESAEEAIQHARNAGAKEDRYVHAVLSTSGKIKEVGVDIGGDADY
ncbi:hypothetical protein [Streptomyces sp. A 4/2]|nr:hypothetical protein [Streptomyces sp. A 4/2]